MSTHNHPNFFSTAKAKFFLFALAVAFVFGAFWFFTSRNASTNFGEGFKTSLLAPAHGHTALHVEAIEAASWSAEHAGHAITA